MQASFTGKGLGSALLATCTCIVAGISGAQAQQYNPRTTAVYQQQQATAIHQQQAQQYNPRTTAAYQQQQATAIHQQQAQQYNPRTTAAYQQQQATAIHQQQAQQYNPRTTAAYQQQQATAIQQQQAQQYNPRTTAAYQQQQAGAIHQQQVPMAHWQQAPSPQRQRQELEAKLLLLHIVGQQARNGQNGWHSQAEQQFMNHLLGNHAGNPQVVAHFKSQLPALVQTRGQGSGYNDEAWMADVQRRMPYLFNNQVKGGTVVTSSLDPASNAGIKQMLGLHPSADITTAAQDPGFLMSLNQGFSFTNASGGNYSPDQAHTNQQHTRNWENMNRPPMLPTDGQGRFGYPSVDGGN